MAPLYRARIRHGELAFPDLYVILGAGEAALRLRRSGDVTRRRRSFEKHLGMIQPLARYFAALAERAPGRVLALDTTRRTPDELVALVGHTLELEERTVLDAVGLLDSMVDWLRTQ